MSRSLTIKEVPAELLDRLKAQAKRESKGYMKVKFHQFIVALLDDGLKQREGEDTNGK